MGPTLAGQSRLTEMCPQRPRSPGPRAPRLEGAGPAWPPGGKGIMSSQWGHWQLAPRPTGDMVTLLWPRALSTLSSGLDSPSTRGETEAYWTHRGLVLKRMCTGSGVCAPCADSAWRSPRGLWPGARRREAQRANVCPGRAHRQGLLEGWVRRAPLDARLAFALGRPVGQQVGLHVPGGDGAAGSGRSERDLCPACC